MYEHSLTYINKRELWRKKLVREHAYPAMFSLCYCSRHLRKSIPSHVQVNIVSYVRLCLFWQAQYAGTASQVILSSHSIPQINGVKFKTVNAMHVCLLHNKKKKKKINWYFWPQIKKAELKREQKCWEVSASLKMEPHHSNRNCHKHCNEIKARIAGSEG